ncbi:hypothetical protein AVEN_172339-1 [Araneus ventricosus]|uniref:RNase H type-1 domain-containing protein n=1 Tax=Araneus ventricosus TaxID=182803 RepID=A0A4Y2E1I1_ARAVE|nr:hypothetical protein AVEN_172339-1 [Araneus ventricosus]
MVECFCQDAVNNLNYQVHDLNYFGRKCLGTKCFLMNYAVKRIALEYAIRHFCTAYAISSPRVCPWSRGLDGVIDLFKLDKFEKLSEIPLNTRVFELRDKVQDSHFEVYTDGSEVDGGVGFSVCILHGEIQHKIICKRLEPQNTVFLAELAALGEAVDWAIENKKKINIYTDSRSSIEALKSYGSRSKFVISIKK